MISVDDFMYFVDDALDGMVAIVTELGDDLANARVDVVGANSAFALLTHCLGVCAHWGGHVIAGRVVERDRAAEFTAQGRVSDLVERVRAARRQLAEDLAGLEPDRPPRGATDREDEVLPLGRTQGGAAIHIFEELAQHRGQMEVWRDVLLARGSAAESR